VVTTWVKEDARSVFVRNLFKGDLAKAAASSKLAIFNASQSAGMSQIQAPIRLDRKFDVCEKTRRPHANPPTNSANIQDQCRTSPDAKDRLKWMLTRMNLDVPDKANIPAITMIRWPQV
jgi:hypothetical protein